jgi:hypothetical protein
MVFKKGSREDISAYAFHFIAGIIGYVSFIRKDVSLLASTLLCSISF